jgi:hypothetical protein
MKYDISFKHYRSQGFSSEAATEKKKNSSPIFQERNLCILKSHKVILLTKHPRDLYCY